MEHNSKCKINIELINTLGSTANATLPHICSENFSYELKKKFFCY